MGEVVGDNPDRLCIAAYKRSRPSAALRRAGRALMLTVVDDALYRVTLAIKRMDWSVHDTNVLVEARVVEVDEDWGEYAPVTHGLEYEVDQAQRDAVLGQWQRTIDE